MNIFVAHQTLCITGFNFETESLVVRVHIITSFYAIKFYCHIVCYIFIVIIIIIIYSYSKYKKNQKTNSTQKPQ